MKCINQVFMLGRLGADPEIKQTKEGKSYARLRVATKRSWKNVNGEFEERTDWHKVTVWGPKAEQCADRLSKGSPVFIEGELQRFSYDREGEKQFQTVINANDITFMSLTTSSITPPFQRKDELTHIN
jgi:single-strand DNA-binding protein